MKKGSWETLPWGQYSSPSPAVVSRWGLPIDSADVSYAIKAWNSFSQTEYKLP